MQPAVEISNLSKRYVGGGALIPLPHRFGARFLERGGRVGIEDVDDEMDDEMGDEEEDDEEDVEREPREVWALKDVSLDVAPGTRLGIIGADGSGKSTLINILSRTSIPTEGTVTLRGRVAPLLRAVQGMLFATSSGRDNVVHVGRIIGVGRDEALERVDEVVALSEIGPKIDKRVKTYSTGELQRFAFAIVLGLRPDVLLSDNVVAVGDHHFRQRCIEHLERASAGGLTLLFASHNMDLVRRLCTEAILLDRGRILERGNVEEVIARYERSPSGPMSLHESLDRAEDGSPRPGVTVGIFSTTGQPVDLLCADDEALVELEFEVTDAPVTMRCVLVLASSELQLRSVQTEMFDAQEPGLYRVSARVPPGTLPDGAYTGRVGVLRFAGDGRELVHRRDNAFHLEVYGAAGTPADARLPRGAKRNVSLGWSVERA